MFLTSSDGIEIGNHFGRNPEPRSLKILAKMLAGRCSGDHQNIGRSLEQPGKRHLRGRGIEAGGDIGQRRSDAAGFERVYPERRGV